MTTLGDCCQRYEADLARLTAVYSLSSITNAHRQANRNVFDRLVQIQCQIDAHRAAPAHPLDRATPRYCADSESGNNSVSSERINCCFSSSATNGGGQRAAKDVSKSTFCATTAIRTDIARHVSTTSASTYPTSVQYQAVHPVLSLRQVLPIPDIHKVSDCDLIYRFLIAHGMNECRALDDILDYIALRQKYRLDTILWERDLHALIHGNDGPELLSEILQGIQGNLHTNNNNSGSGDGVAHTTKSASRAQSLFHFFKSAPSACVSDARCAKMNVRPLLQPGWGASVCGLDRTGHVLLYHRVSIRHLALLLERWPCNENARGDAKAGTNDTSGVENLLLQLYLRNIEKGRRIAQLLQYRRACKRAAGSSVQDAVHGQLPYNTGCSTSCNNERSDNSANQALSGADVGDSAGARYAWANLDNVNNGITCLIDVADVKLTQLTSSKYKNVIATFRLFSLLTQTYFPENLHRILIVNSGFVLSMLFTLMKTWLDPLTLSKIVLVDGKCVGHGSGGKEAAAARERSGEAVKSAGQRSSKDTALYRHLLEYIEDAFIPDVYGGKLRAYDAPHFYEPLRQDDSDGGRSEQAYDIRTHPCYPDALARIKDSVYHDLLTDSWIYEHAAGEGAAVTDEEREMFQEYVRAYIAETQRRID